jgi:glycosyltransferase involved in cell wall biosynthesis
MRVMMINLGYPPNVIGGAELAVQALARELARKAIAVSVVSLAENATDWHYDDEGVGAYFIAAHPMGNLLLNPHRTPVQKVKWHLLGEFNIWVSGKLTKIIEAERPDLIHTHNLLGLSVAAWRVARARCLPVIHTLHDYQLICPRGTMFRRGRPCTTQCTQCRLFTTRRRNSSAVPTAVVGISQFVLTTHRNHGYFPRAFGTIIPSSLRLQASPQRMAGRKAGAPLRIGYIGRLHPTKGIELLLGALSKLPAGSYRARIAGTGNPAYERRLRSIARGLAVEFPGWVPSPQFYEEIDVLVVPSVYFEPQGMVLVEAASFGLPVLYSNRGGLGEMGAVFPGLVPFDSSGPDELAQLLAGLIKDPPCNREPTVVSPIPASFELDNIASAYRRLYESAMRGATS